MEQIWPLRGFCALAGTSLIEPESPVPNNSKSTFSFFLQQVDHLSADWDCHIGHSPYSVAWIFMNQINGKSVVGVSINLNIRLGRHTKTFHHPSISRFPFRRISFPPLLDPAISRPSPSLPGVLQWTLPSDTSEVLQYNVYLTSLGWGAGAGG